MKNGELMTGDGLYNRIDQLAIGVPGQMGAARLAERLGIAGDDNDERWNLACLSAMVNPRVLKSPVGLMILTGDDRRIIGEIISGTDELVDMLGRAGIPMNRWNRINGIYGGMGPEVIRKMHQPQGEAR